MDALLKAFGIEERAQARSMQRMVSCHWGSTRCVVLVGRWAVKFPRLSGRFAWNRFLRGLLANMQERLFWETRWPELCPVVWSVAGGWLVVMRRATPMTPEEWETFDALKWSQRDDYVVPVECKRDSFGWVDGNLVAVDYGS